MLDAQLQGTISGFDHTLGSVVTIDEKKSSKDLRDALNDGKRIIVTTLQKFPVIYEQVDDTTGKSFAIIVDEAHSSQTGQSAMKLKIALADTHDALKEYAELEGTTRTISQETRLQVREWIDQTAEQIAAISGAEARVIWSDITSALINDPQVSREAAEVAKGLGDHIQVVTNRPLSLGGDNFAEYQRFVPGCYAYIGTANTDLPSTLNSLHNGNFDLDENALVLGAGLYVGYALWWLGRQEKP